MRQDHGNIFYSAIAHEVKTSIKEQFALDFILSDSTSLLHIA